MTAEMFEQEWAQVKPGIRRYIQRRVQGPDAEDLVQEAALSCYLEASRHPLDSLAHTAIRKADALIRTYYRRQQRETSTPVDLMDCLPAPDPDATSHQVLEALQLASVLKAADRLSQHEQFVLRTSLAHDADTAAASAIGLSVHTYRRDLRRARKNLARILEPA